MVGIGPGDYENMTVRADRALGACQVIVGYHVYVDLVKERYPDKEFLTTPMTKEADRCRMALDAARSGKDVAMVCSGDSGIYGMAGLLYELRGEAAEPEIQVVPHGGMQRRGPAGGAPDPRLRRHQPQRPAHPLGED